MAAPRIVLIDDHALCRNALADLLRTRGGMEVLAAVEPEPGADFDRLLRLVLCHRDELTSCLVVMAGWDEPRRDFLRKLAAGGVNGIPLIVGRGAPPEGVGGYWLESGELARDLRRLPTRLSPI